jgi:hypothetical protein
MGVAGRQRVLGICCAAVLAGACGAPAPAPAPAAAQKTVSPVERGQYLVTVVGCNDCHTPMKMGANGPEPDMTRLLSGHPQELKLKPPKLPTDGWMFVGSSTLTAFAGPWGITYAINLTPDQSTGIGAWTEDLFVGAMRTGKHMGASRPIQPPMPWPWYAKMTDDDLKAMYAYLRSIPPISNQVPAYEPPAAPKK